MMLGKLFLLFELSLKDLLEILIILFFVESLDINFSRCALLICLIVKKNREILDFSELVSQFLTNSHLLGHPVSSSSVCAELLQ